MCKVFFLACVFEALLKRTEGKIWEGVGKDWIWSPLSRERHREYTNRGCLVQEAGISL